VLAGHRSGPTPMKTGCQDRCTPVRFRGPGGHRCPVDSCRSGRRQGKRQGPRRKMMRSRTGFGDAQANRRCQSGGSLFRQSPRQAPERSLYRPRMPFYEARKKNTSAVRAGNLQRRTTPPDELFELDGANCARDTLDADYAELPGLLCGSGQQLESLPPPDERQLHDFLEVTWPLHARMRAGRSRHTFPSFGQRLRTAAQPRRQKVTSPSTSPISAGPQVSRKTAKR